MRRRDIIAGLGSVAALGGAGWYAFDGSVSFPGDATKPASGSDERLDPVNVETLEAPHSTAGTMTVPVPDTVTVVDLFATWCSGCDDQLRRLATARERLGDSVQFVSVTNQALGGGLTRGDLRAFWRENAGTWPVAFDDGGALTTRLGTPGLPFTAVVDPAGRVVFTERGLTTVEAVVSAVERSRSVSR